MESIFSCGLFVCEKSFSKISLFLSPSLFICVSMSLSLCLSVSLSLLYSTLLDQISEKWDLIFLHAGTTCGDLNITHDILMITSEDTRMTFTMALLREWWLDAWPQVPGFSLLPRAGGDPPLSKFQKKNWKVAIWGDSLVHRWIEEMKRSILSPFPGVGAIPWGDIQLFKHSPPVNFTLQKTLSSGVSKFFWHPVGDLMISLDLDAGFPLVRFSMPPPHTIFCGGPGGAICKIGF